MMKNIVPVKQMHGFSLIELLVAMVLGLILMSGVISVFINSKQGYVQQDASSQMQENARFALEMINRETRMAGYGGCSDAISVANTLDGYTGLASGFTDGLTGYEGDATNSTFPADFKSVSEPNTDAIILHTVNNSSALSVDSHNPNAATIHLTSATTIQTGDILLMVDANCTNMAIFANTGPTNNSNNATNSNHNTGNISSFSYDNCTKAIKGDFDCDDTSGAVSEAYSKGSSLFTIDSFAYYIGKSSTDNAILSLYRLDIGGIAQEMIEGVTDLEIFYGLSTGSNVQYLKAKSVTSDQWPDIDSVRFKVTTRSLSLINGNPVTKSFISTVRLRNRG
jgi:type IV pilus assembly protein PilW